MNIKKTREKLLKNGYVWLNRTWKGLNKNCALFVSFDGRSYSDNPRAISEKLHSLHPDVRIIWFLKKAASREMVPPYVEVVDPSDAKAYYATIAQAPVVVTNFAFPDFRKSKKQFFIQTWHGDRAFKKIQYDNPFVEPDYHRAESEEGFCNLCVAGSDYGERKFRSAFRYKGEILNMGTPRDDRLVNPDPDEIRMIKERLGIAMDAKILLYAPTIRKDQKKGFEVKDIDLEKTLSTLKDRFEGDWVCLVRAHPGNKQITGVEKSDKLIDVSSYGDMADLLLVSDVLITDYSSTAGDYALLRRPLILFQADREEYTQHERTFYFDVNASPYFIADSQESLEKIILGLTPEGARENCDAILDFYGCHESGKASEIVADRIYQWLNGKK